jgi:hypothetical protein
MKKLITPLVLVLILAFACKKKSQYCYYLGKDGNRVVYAWEYNRPSNTQIQQVQDTCFCTLKIEETCLPCKPRTDSSGTDLGCE